MKECEEWELYKKTYKWNPCKAVTKKPKIKKVKKSWELGRGSSNAGGQWKSCAICAPYCRKGVDLHMTGVTCPFSWNAPFFPSRKKILRDRHRMLDYIEMKEDIRHKLGRREDGDGEELGVTGVWSQGELQ